MCKEKYVEYIYTSGLYIAMATVYDYTFYNLSRVGDDATDQSQRTIQNAQYNSYMLENYRPACPMKNALDFATSQVNVNVNGSYSVGIGGCNIDTNTDLTHPGLVHPRCKISLVQRPFATVPFLGRGKSDPVLEAQIQQGDLANNRKSLFPSSEISYTPYYNTPMIPSLSATITNPANLIEDVAADGWIRGGLSSRELIRDKDYLNCQVKDVPQCFTK